MKPEDFLNAPLPTLLVIAGFIFLLLSVATIKKPIVIDITDNGRKVAGVIGGLLLAIGIILFIYILVTPKQTPTQTPTLTPTLTPLLTSTPTLTLTPIQTPTDSHLEVLSLFTEFFIPKDRPPRSIPIDIPRHVFTNGKSYSSAGDDLHVWIIICPLIPQPCSIKELKLDTAGEWADIIDVGTKDDCSSFFDIYFILTSKEVNDLLNTFKQDGIRKDVYESFEYKDKDAFIVVRSLEDNGIDACSQATK